MLPDIVGSRPFHRSEKQRLTLLEAECYDASSGLLPRGRELGSALSEPGNRVESWRRNAFWLS